LIPACAARSYWI